MANPVGSILHNRWTLSDVTDRSSKYTFGITTQMVDSVGGLVTPLAGDIEVLQVALQQFLQQDATGQTNSLQTYLSQACSQANNASEIVSYDVSNALALHEVTGPPYAISPFTLVIPSGEVNLPEQVAQVISWRTNYGTDEEFGTNTRPAADDRARMYFGPLNVAALAFEAGSPGRSKWSTTFLDDVSVAFNQMNTVLLANAGGTSGQSWQIVVWSRKLGVVKIAYDFSQQLYPATQRRRLDVRPNLVWTPFVTQP